MKKILLCHFVFLFILSGIQAQIFKKKYDVQGIEVVLLISATKDGGNISAGLLYGKKNDIIIIKTNTAGNVQWSKKWSSDKSAAPSAIIQTRDGGYAISGSGNNGTRGSILLLKLNANGTTQWAKHYTSEGRQLTGAKLAQTPDGGYVIAGAKFASYPRRPCLLKTDSTGNLIWSKFIFHQGYSVEISDLALTNDGGFILVGGNWPTDDTVSSSGAHLIKLKSNGTVQWAKALGSNFDKFRFVKQTKDGAYLLGGSVNSSEYGNDMFIAKVNKAGVPLWSKRIRGMGTTPSTKDEGFYDALEIPGGYVAVGYTGSYELEKPVLARFTTGGALVKSVILSAPDSVSITATTDYKSGFAITLTNTYNAEKWYIAKFNNLGNTCGATTNFGEVKDTGSFKTGIVPVTNFGNMIITPSSVPTVSINVKVEDVCDNFSSLSEADRENLIKQNILSHIQVSPNPVTNTLYLKWLGGQQVNTSLVIYSASGKKMYDKTLSNSKGNHNIAIPVNNFPGGIYMLKLKSGTNIETVKFVKE